MVKPLVASMSERAWLDEMQRAQLTAYLVAARQLRALCFGVVLAFAQSMLCFGLHCKRTHLACGAGMAREIIACSLLNEFYFLWCGFARRDRVNMGI